ncbi:MAG TPA: ubiquitin-like small modifier protein 1, partial [Methanomicrobiales archaeon]|nr:ubiquitin-like small modifier protein 1 [Methanomicrobiales archaeon]
ARFGEILGKEQDVEIEEGWSVKDLLDHLIRLHPRLQDELYDEQGELRDHVNIMRNRRHIEAYNGLLTEVSDGDEIAIFPPVAGG